MLDCQLLWIKSRRGFTSPMSSSMWPWVIGLFLVLRGDDRHVLAECFCGGGLCHPSLAGGIRGMGVRTQRRSERVVLHADERGLHPVHPPSMVGGAIRAGGPDVWIGPNVRLTYSSHFCHWCCGCWTIGRCDAPIRFEDGCWKSCRCWRCPPPRARSTLAGPTQCHTFNRGLFTVVAFRQRDGGSNDLPWRDVLAGRISGVLSVSALRPAIVGGVDGRCDAGGSFPLVAWLWRKNPAVAARRMALVPLLMLLPVAGHYSSRALKPMPTAALTCRKSESVWRSLGGYYDGG